MQASSETISHVSLGGLGGLTHQWDFVLVQFNHNPTTCTAHKRNRLLRFYTELVLVRRA
jgi:hypothetical protein